MGRTMARLSHIKFTKYSLFQYKSARSATWKCWLLIHRANCVKRATWIFWNSFGSVTSRISSTSFRNMTSFGELTLGQYLRSPIMTSSASKGSFSRNWTTQYASWGWYKERLLTLCSGMRTRLRKILCSTLSGTTKPLMMEPRISRSSAMPLCRSVS